MSFGADFKFVPRIPQNNTPYSSRLGPLHRIVTYVGKSLKDNRGNVHAAHSRIWTKLESSQTLYLSVYPAADKGGNHVYAPSAFICATSGRSCPAIYGSSPCLGPFWRTYRGGSPDLSADGGWSAVIKQYQWSSPHRWLGPQ